jgi:hypothetical protein
MKRRLASCLMLALTITGCIVHTNEGDYDCTATVVENQPTTVCTPVPRQSPTPTY